MSAKAENGFLLAEIAEHLGVCKDTIYAWCSEHDMPAIQVGHALEV